MSRPTPPAYKTWNWPAYTEALKRRGSQTIWFDPAMRMEHHEQDNEQVFP